MIASLLGVITVLIVGSYLRDRSYNKYCNYLKSTIIILEKELKHGGWVKLPPRDKTGKFRKGSK